MWKTLTLALALATQDPAALSPGESTSSTIGADDEELLLVLRVPPEGRFFVDVRSLDFDATALVEDVEGAELVESSDGWYFDHPRVDLSSFPGGLVRLRVTSAGPRVAPGRVEVFYREGAATPLGPEARAEALLGEARSVLSEVEDRPDSSIAEARRLRRYGLGLVRSGGWMDARRLLRAALDRYEPLGVTDSEWQDCALDVADIERELGNPDEAMSIVGRVLGNADGAHEARCHTILAWVDLHREFARRSRIEAERALELAETYAGADSDAAAAALEVLAGSLVRVEPAASIEPARRALAIRLARGGDSSLEAIRSQFLLACALRDLPFRDPTAAERTGETDAEVRRMYQECLEAHLESFGHGHPLEAWYRFGIGRMSYLDSLRGPMSQRSASQARAFREFERAIDIGAHALGADHVIVVRGRLVSIDMLLQSRRYEAALTEASIVRSLTRDSDPALKAQVDSFAARVEIEVGKYEDAARSLRDAIGFVDAEHEDMAEVGDFLNGLAVALMQLGRYSEARPLFEDAVSRFAGIHRANELVARQNLAVLQYLQGNLAEAMSTLRALVDDTSVDEPAHALALANLGVGMLADGDPDAACKTLEDTLRLLGDGGTAGRLVMQVRQNLAAALARVGRYEEARQILAALLEEQLRTLGPSHPDVASTRMLLGDRRLRDGDSDGARQQLAAAAERLSATLGEAHPLTIRATARRALLELDAGSPAEAVSLCSQALRHALERIDAELWVLTEGERLARITVDFELVELALAALALDRDAHARDAWALVTRWKGQVYRSLVRDRSAAVASADPETLVELADTRAAVRDLTALAWSRDVTDRAAREREVAEARATARRAEEALLRRVGGLIDDRSRSNRVDVDAIERALPPGKVLLDFLVHREYVPSRRGGESFEPGGMGIAHVSAFVLGPEPGRLRWVDLGPASTLEAAVRDHVSTLTSSERGVRPEGAPLLARDLVWRPLAGLVGAAEHVIVVPDRFLGRLPFETLVDDAGHYLLEDHAFSYLPDAPSLVHFATAAPAPAGPARALVVGDVDYDVHQPSTDEHRGYQDWFGSLENTGEEAERIQGLLRKSGVEALWLRGAEATEPAVKAASAGRRFIHLATHGFAAQRALPAQWLAEPPGGALPSSLTQDHVLTSVMPSLFAALVFAGANDPGDSAEDGLLTASETSWLDLSAADLVVLSACESGLGAEHAAEGMMSLQRAFHVGGARSVIASHWRVSDEKTRELMGRFYERRLTRGQGTLEALRGAQLEMLAHNRAADARGRAWTWGAFSLSGAW